MAMAIQKLAVAIIHGAGHSGPNVRRQDDEKHTEQVQSVHPATKVPDPDSQLVFEAVYWAPAMQTQEDELWRRTKSKVKLHQNAGETIYRELRRRRLRLSTLTA